MFTHNDRPKKLGARFILLATTVVLTSGYAIPIGIASLSERRERVRSTSTVQRTKQAKPVTKRCPHETEPGPTRKAVVEAINERAPGLLRWIL
jgi:hypothetical protein